MQNIYGISVKNGEKLETLLRVEIERKLTIFEKNLFGQFWLKIFFSFFFSLDILTFQIQIVLSFLVFHQKNIYFPIEKNLRSIERTQRKLFQKVPPGGGPLGQGWGNTGFSRVNSTGDYRCRPFLRRPLCFPKFRGRLSGYLE